MGPHESPRGYMISALLEAVLGQWPLDAPVKVSFSSRHTGSDASVRIWNVITGETIARTCRSGG